MKARKNNAFPAFLLNTTEPELVQEPDYDEWRLVLKDINARFQPFELAGGLHDRVSKFVRFGARDYHPRTET